MTGQNLSPLLRLACWPFFLSCFFCFICSVFAQMAVLKKHHRAAHHGHYYECLVKFKGVAYNKVYLFALPRCTVGGVRCQVSRWCLSGAVGDSITHKVEVLRCLHLRVMSWQIVARLEHWILLCWLSGCGQLAHKKSARVRVRC